MSKWIAEFDLEDGDKMPEHMDLNYMGAKIDFHCRPMWIPVSERLPEEPYGCLVTVEDEEPMTGQMFEVILPYFVGWDGERWNDSDGEQCPFEVIAWMPLPESYKVESEDEE